MMLTIGGANEKSWAPILMKIWIGEFGHAKLDMSAHEYQ
jgi:hypothetical protein